MFFGVFLAEDIDGLEDKVSGDTVTLDLQTPLEDFLNISLRYACFTDEAFFSGKVKTIHLLGGLLSLLEFPNYWTQIKGIFYI